MTLTVAQPELDQEQVMFPYESLPMLIQCKFYQVIQESYIRRTDNRNELIRFMYFLDRVGWIGESLQE